MLLHESFMFTNFIPGSKTNFTMWFLDIKRWHRLLIFEVKSFSVPVPYFLHRHLWRSIISCQEFLFTPLLSRIRFTECLTCRIRSFITFFQGCPSHTDNLSHIRLRNLISLTPILTVSSYLLLSWRIPRGLLTKILHLFLKSPFLTACQTHCNL